LSSRASGSGIWHIVARNNQTTRLPAAVRRAQILKALAMGPRTIRQLSTSTGLTTVQTTSYCRALLKDRLVSVDDWVRPHIWTLKHARR